MGRNSLELIRATFRLEGEHVVRIRTGKTVRPPTKWPPNVTVVLPGGGRKSLQYHRIKFALIHGYLPSTVDHRDRNSANHAGSNLRAASVQQQVFNRRPPCRSVHLPRGVVQSVSGKRYRAWVTVDGKRRHLGYHETPEAASRVVEAQLKEAHGEFYAAPPHSCR